MKVYEVDIKKVLPHLPILRYGSRGYYVKELQRLLNKVGYSLKVDGIFGPRTLAAVKDFQKRNLLTIDGIVGVRTWSTLIRKAGELPLILSNQKPLPVSKTEKVSITHKQQKMDIIELVKILSPFLILGGILLAIKK